MSTKENKKNNTGLIIISSLLGLIVGGVLALASGIDLGGKDEPTYVDNGQFFSGEIVYGSKDVYKSGVIMLANHGHDVPAVNYTIEDLPSELVSNSTASINGTKVCFKIEDTGSGLVAKEIFIPSKANECRTISDDEIINIMRANTNALNLAYTDERAYNDNTSHKRGHITGISQEFNGGYLIGDIRITATGQVYSDVVIPALCDQPESSNQPVMTTNPITEYYFKFSPLNTSIAEEASLNHTHFCNN